MNLDQCQLAFEELYKNSPAPITLRAGNSFLNKSIFHSPLALPHPLISPRPLSTTLSGFNHHKAEFESLKKACQTGGGDADVNIASDHNVEKTGACGDDVTAKEKQQQVGCDKFGSRTMVDGPQPENDTASDDDNSFLMEDDATIDADFFFKKPSWDGKAPSQNDIPDSCPDEDLSDHQSTKSDRPRKITQNRPKRNTKTTDQDAPTKMYNWIIIWKPECNGVVLDGKKDKATEEYWQTSMVMRRLGPYIVSTASGSNFQLVGKMNVYEAIEGGIPKSIAQRFTSGFPVKWQEILDDVFRPSVEESEEEEEMDDDSQTDEEERQKLSELKIVSSSREYRQSPFYLHSQDSDDSDVGPRLRRTRQQRACATASKVKHSAVSSTEKEVFTDTKVEGGCPKSCVTRGAAKTNPKPCKGGVNSSLENEPDKKEVLSLYLWIIKPMPNGKGVCIEGQKRLDTEYWSSSMVVGRLSHKQVRTISGTVYNLKGNMERTDCLEAGMSERVVKAFHRGFPAHWKRLLKDYYVNISSDILQSKHRTVREKVDKKTTKRKGKQEEENEVLSTLDMNKTICTPLGHLVDVENLPTTRSGRSRVPRLAWWMGQRRTYDSHGNVIEMKCGTPYAASSLKQSYHDMQTRIRQKIVRTSTTYNLESEVLGVIEQQKQERGSRSKRKTCYDSQPDVTPVSQTVLKEKSMVKDTGSDDNKQDGKMSVYNTDSSPGEAQRRRRSRRTRQNIKVPVISDSDDGQQQVKETRRGKSGLGANRPTHTDSDSDEETRKRTTSVKLTKLDPGVFCSELDDENIVDKKAGKRSQRVKNINNKTYDSDRKVGCSRQTRARKSRFVISSDEGSDVKQKTGTLSSSPGNNDSECESSKVKSRTRQTKIVPRKRKSAKLSLETDVECSKSKKSKRYAKEYDGESSSGERKHRSRKNKKGESKWGQLEIKRLYKALLTTREDNPHFWEIIAEEVQTKTPDECRVYYEHSPKPDPAPQKVSKSKPRAKPPRKKKGKAKDEDDDFFKATPFMPENRKFKTFHLTEDESEDFEDECVPTPGVLHKTPVVRDGHQPRPKKLINRLDRPDTLTDDIETTTTSVNAKKVQTKPKITSSGIEGLAGKGTMKRREQLREMYAEINEDADDDIFNATPLRGAENRKPVMSMFTLTEDEELDFEAGCAPTPGNQHKTPSVRDQHRSRLASDTPSTSTKMVTTPWLNPLSRKTADQVIARHKRKGGKQTKLKLKPTNENPNTEASELNTAAPKSLFKGNTTLTNIFEEVEADHDDGNDEELDYYWSDEN